METLLFLAGGIIIGIIIQKRQSWRPYIDKSITVMIWILLFSLGIAIGSNNEVLNNIHTIGWKALILSGGSIIGSIICSYFVYLKFFKS
ncbi:MAG: LysO family transporter [Mangrovibacterium sp.]